jgi:hypothetical protein
MVRTTRNCALPLVMRASAAAAFPRGCVSIMDRTPEISANLELGAVLQAPRSDHLISSARVATSLAAGMGRERGAPCPAHCAP